ncbi:5-formyltetrahydrofolate cyclo-ligase [Virgibacillus ainsalahensis]
MDKLQLRKSAIAKLKSISVKEKQNLERLITNNLLHSTLWKDAHTIGITISQGFEWDTKQIIEAAWDQNKSVCVPKCNPQQKSLTFYQLDTYEQLEVVYYNLLEPKPEAKKRVEKLSIDLLVVPGLMFNTEGYRIGFGGGYYDRFLTDFTNETVSILSTDQLVNPLPSEIYDIPVNYLITEKGIINKK